MYLELDTSHSLAYHIPELALNELRSHGRKHVVQRQFFISRLLQVFYERRRPHALDRDADSFDRAFLDRGLRVNKGRYAPLLRPFYAFPEGNRDYSRDRGITKPYRIHPHVLAIMDGVRAGSLDCPAVWVDDDGNRTQFTDLSECDPSSGTPHVQTVVTIPLDTVEAAIGVAERWVAKCRFTPLDPAKPHGMTVAQEVGGLPNFYFVQANGRLGPRGFHLIALPSRIRHMLFDRSGMMDYDIRACFWTILQSLSRSLSIATPLLDDYTNDRDRWHSSWAQLTGAPKGCFKGIATAWLSGGTLSPAGLNSAARSTGEEAVRQLQNDRSTTQLYGELKSTLKSVVKHRGGIERDGAHRTSTNAVGKTITLAGDSSDFGRLCSHVLTGYEQFAMQAICSHATGVQAIIYDGFIAPQQRIEPVEAAVRNRSRELLGISLEIQLKEQSLSADFPEPQCDGSCY